MRKIYILLLGFFIALQVNVLAQPEQDNTDYKLNIPGLNVPSLVFTEFRGDVNDFYYLELSNVGQEDIDLSKFGIISAFTYTALRVLTDSLVTLGNKFSDVPLSGTLAAGESYVLTNVWDAFYEDGLPRHSVALLDVADRLFHQEEANTYEFLNKPEWEAYATDSVTEPNFVVAMTGSSGYYLKYIFINNEGNPDSTLVDNVNISYDPYLVNGPEWGQGNLQWPVAGITDAIANYILVRKSSVTQGSIDWHLSRGTDLATSEWLPVPVNYSQFDVFTTIGTHGNFSLDFVAENPEKVIINETENTITLPWEVVAGDAVCRELTLGDGMSWSYEQHPDNFASTTVKTGDTLSLYALGDDIEKIDLSVIVTPPTTDLAVAYSKKQAFEVLELDEVVDVNWLAVYETTQGLDTDSIYNVPFATPVDTLFKYLEKPEKANWEIVFAGNETRADLKEGDVLKVTSEDGAVIKEYIIKVDEYEENTNARLSMISWPGVDLDVYWENWITDTIPGFSPSISSYFIKLAENAKAIPALQFKAEDVNASIDVVRAIDINGSIDQRTTTITVTAEDGETTQIYTVLFELKSKALQPNFAEPFISEIAMGTEFTYNIEIYNPGNQELDLNRYMLVSGTADGNLQDAVGRLGNVDLVKLNNHRIYEHHYVPGMRFKHDEDAVAWGAEKGFLIPDNVTNTIVKPGDVFLAGSINDGGWPGGRFYPDRYYEGFTDIGIHGELFDFIWYGWSNEEVDTSPIDEINDQYNLNPWGTKLHRYRTVSYLDFRTLSSPNSSLFLLKIMNDSILDGSKDVTDPEDYIIVDRLQKDLSQDKFWLAGRDLTTPNWNGWIVGRKPDVWKGTTERAEGFGDDFGQSAENSEYIVFNKGDSARVRSDFWDGLGWHSMDEITVYISMVTSTKLIVTNGYEGEQTITGDLSGITVESISALLDKADPGQTFVFLNGADTLSNNDAVAADMKLIVNSADLRNSTSYTLIDSPLDADNLLVAVDGSGLTVTLSGNQGTVAGVTIGSSISSLLDNLTVPELAVLNVIDDDDNLIPLEATNFDSVMIEMIVGPNVFFEVIAENADIAIYSLDFGLEASDAYLLSNVFNIDINYYIVDDVPVGISVDAILDLVFPNENATIKITDKTGFERTSGQLNLDDLIVVTSADQSVTQTYYLNFIDEINPDLGDNRSPTVSVSGVTTVEPGTPVTFTATASDDNHGGSTLSYLWEITSGDAGSVSIATPDQLSTDVTFSTSGSFDLTFTGSDGELSASVVSTIFVAYVGINQFDNSSIRIYPNPAKSNLFVEFDNGINSSARLQIVDMTGKVVYNKLHFDAKANINLENLENGIYFMSIEIDNQISVYKISKMH
ncbi:MAG: T9SS type A sorting domain-containing protein [Bacteroidales bacterium]|nr:T9SS type A sorting domain-containing protein [Bacteroidales bacterium]